MSKDSQSVRKLQRTQCLSDRFSINQSISQSINQSTVNWFAVYMLESRIKTVVRQD